MSKKSTSSKSKRDPELLKARALGILNKLCLVGGSMRLSALSDNSKTFFYQDPLEFLKQFPNFFRLECKPNESDWLVHAHTHAELCQDFVKQSGCVNLDCEKLHLCKHFVTGRCRFGDNCRSSHLVRSQHNDKVLGIHDLGSLDDEMIRLVLKQSSIDITVPDICTHYNSTHGCKKDKQCPFLHVCRHYITGDCRYTNNKRQQCRFSHNILDGQPLLVLKKFNIDIHQGHDMILDMLKYKKNHDAKPSVDPNAVAQLGDDLAKKGSITGKNVNRNQLTGQLDDVFVCVFNLQGKCNYDNSCFNLHTEEPFQWVYKEASKNEWQKFSDSANIKIEDDFCRADKDGYVISMTDNSDGVILNGATINFDTMKVDSYGLLTPIEVQRISPPGVAQGWRKGYATQWMWYWKDEIGTWIEYGKQNLTGTKSDIDSIKLEGAYQNHMKEGSSRYLDFQTDSNQYRLDLEGKIQKNIVYGTERRLRRRPLLVSKQVLNERHARLQTQSSCTVPEHWDIYAESASPHGNFQCCPVGKGSEEYQRVELRFKKTMPNRIVCIERVQNMDLWEDYSRKKDRLEKKYNGRKVPEEMLFHGTKKEAMDAICQQNFDWRLSGTRVGSLLGQGSYFHKKAKYSDRYADQDTDANKFMFVAKVLVGKYTRGSETLRRPPPVDPNQPHHDLYDTCVDNEGDPNIFVVFENNQVYPEYIIKYSVVAHAQGTRI